MGVELYQTRHLWTGQPIRVVYNSCYIDDYLTVEELTVDGWKVIPTRMKKELQALEDFIWKLLYETGKMDEIRKQMLETVSTQEVSDGSPPD